MTAKEILKRKFHGFSDEQWEELKDQFPYSEIPSAMESYAKQQAWEAYKESEKSYALAVNRYISNEDDLKIEFEEWYTKYMEETK